MNLNIMMDPRNMFPKMFHPASNNMSLDWKGSAKYYSRTQRPTKYYIIDFGLSDKFNPEDGPPSAWPIESGDRTVPEFRNKAAWKNHDPFPTDVYYLGNLIREDFFQVSGRAEQQWARYSYVVLIQRFRGVEFMRPLVDDMVQEDPAKRPNMDEVVERFDKIRASLGWWTLRKRLVPLEDEFPIPATIRHLFRTAIDILAFRSALPTPKA